MKALNFIKWTMLLVLGAFVLTSCSDDDDYEAPDAVKAAFTQKYGDANNVSWRQNSKGKHVASFMAAGKKSDAWFESNGTWIMTKIELGTSLSVLPDAVAEAYNCTHYAAEGWTIDEIEEIQRADEAGSVFKIEVEKDGQPDYDLYFSETGMLIDEVMDVDDGDEDEEDFDDDEDGDLEPTIPFEIHDFVKNNFIGAEIIDCDFEDGMYEVAIGKENEVVILHFDRSFTFIRAIYNHIDKMPDFVKEIISKHYAGKKIDDCLYVEEVGVEPYYLIDFEYYDKSVKITMDGRFVEIAD